MKRVLKGPVIRSHSGWGDKVKDYRWALIGNKWRPSAVWQDPKHLQNWLVSCPGFSPEILPFTHIGAKLDYDRFEAERAVVSAAIKWYEKDENINYSNTAEELFQAIESLPDRKQKESE